MNKLEEATFQGEVTFSFPLNCGDVSAVAGGLEVDGFTLLLSDTSSCCIRAWGSGGYIISTREYMPGWPV